jgi:hypothetical protein
MKIIINCWLISFRNKWIRLGLAAVSRCQMVDSILYCARPCLYRQAELLYNTHIGLPVAMATPFWQRPCVWTGLRRVCVCYKHCFRLLRRDVSYIWYIFKHVCLSLLAIHCVAVDEELYQITQLVYIVDSAKDGQIFFGVFFYFSRPFREGWFLAGSSSSFLPTIFTSLYSWRTKKKKCRIAPPILYIFPNLCVSPCVSWWLVSRPSAVPNFVLSNFYGTHIRRMAEIWQKEAKRLLLLW